MPRDKAGLRSMPLSGLSTNGAPIECFESRLNHNFGVLRLEFHQVQDRMRRLERTVEKIPERLTEYMDKALQPLPDMAVVEHMERIHDAEKADLEEKHRRQVESLLEEKADDKAQLEKMELDLHFANMRADIAAKDLAETRLQMEAHARQLSKAGGPGVENPDEVVRAAFLGLRESISDLCRSPALELGPLNDSRHTDGGGADSFCDRETWNRSSPSQRRRRIMAHVFHLLFRRILRSGLRLFGLQAFIKSDENHWISAEEAHLRALEKELEARQVDNATLAAWIATTLDVTAPLRDVTRNVEGVTQEIFDALSPVIKLASGRSADKLKDRISAVCQEAVHLKLAMRRHPGNYMVEVPSRDVKKWGQSGCDHDTRALKPEVWLQVVGHESGPADDDEWRQDGAKGRRSGGDIACIPFGALTKVEVGPGGEKRKVVLEKGWVIARGVAGKQTSKRTAPATAAEDDSEPLRKRVAPNRGISPAQLKRIKALMGDDE